MMTLNELESCKKRLKELRGKWSIEGFGSVYQDRAKDLEYIFKDRFSDDDYDQAILTDNDYFFIDDLLNKEEIETVAILRLAEFIQGIHPYEEKTFL